MERPMDDKLNVSCEAGGGLDTRAEDAVDWVVCPSLEDDGTEVGIIEELEFITTAQVNQREGHISTKKPKLTSSTHRNPCPR
jgi:hypothetical protein